MSTRRGFIAFTASAVAAGTVLPATAAIPTPPAAPVRDTAGKWPRDLFPPGQHPTDAYGPAIPVEPSDAELIALCAEFDDLERQCHASYLEVEEDTPAWDAAEAERERIYTAQTLLVARMVEIRVVTSEGHAARARSLDLFGADCWNDNGFTSRLTRAVMRDLIGEARS